jgi:hypothetical protein
LKSLKMTTKVTIPKVAEIFREKFNVIETEKVKVRRGDYLGRESNDL